MQWVSQFHLRQNKILGKFYLTWMCKQMHNYPNSLFRVSNFAFEVSY
jgi:hypothetical protein